MTFFGYGLLPLADTEQALAVRLGELAHSDLMVQAAAFGVNTTATTAVPGTTAASVEQVLARVQEIAALRADFSELPPNAPPGTARVITGRTVRQQS
jgi:DNA ligase (NAD+)